MNPSIHKSDIDHLINKLKLRQKRHSREEKDRFLKFLKSELETLGYENEISKAGFPTSKHLETKTNGSCETILMAHYDTSTTLPIWIEYLMRISGHTRTLLTIIIVLGLFQFMTLINNDLISNLLRLSIAASVLIPVLFISNKHTMNDNTSGVLSLLLLAKKISKLPELKDKVKFVFTDNEERSLIGTYQLRKIWDKQSFNYSHCKIISIDSVGRGNEVVLSYNIHKSLAVDLGTAFSKNGIQAHLVNMGFVPFSDAYNFRKLGAININLMNKSLIPGGFYIKNIHSKRDRKISKGNIKLVIDAVERFLKMNIQ